MVARLLDRRSFMRAAGASFAATLLPQQALALQRSDAVFATAYQKRDGAYGVAVLSEAREILFTAELPERGHDVTFDPVSGRSVVFARQPGTFMTIFDHRERLGPVTVPSIAGRHFFGHGVFSPDGRLLYATENDFDNATGMVGVYDATDRFRRIGEFATGGVGPHEIILLGDGRTLAIANGGIETHPDFGRAKLNISTMKPSLVFVDRLSGQVTEKHALPADLHKLSIRHMDIDESGTVWFGCQHEGSASERPLLVGTARPGGEMRLVEMPEDVLGDFRNYVGSVAANRDAGTVAVSSPQGYRMALIEARTGRLIQSRELVEVCGLAPEGDGYRASTGTGKIVDLDGSAATFDDIAWDNHMLRIIS